MLLWLVPQLALAHRPGLSYARVEGDSLALTFAAADLPSDDHGLAVMATGLIARADVRSDGEDCRPVLEAVQALEADAVLITARLDCAPGAFTLQAAYLDQLGPGHRQYLEVDGRPLAVLDASAASAEWTSEPAGAGEVAWRFGELGVSHIVTGYDHLLFLLAVSLTATRARDLLFVVTGFTIAHSVTLTLGATGAVVLPPAVVEPAIAATIIFVGLENLWRPPTRRRVAVTFLLGLVHGFGFAGLLAELGLPADALAVALLSFNLGVEAGQAFLVMLALPLLLAAGRWAPWRDKVVPAISIAIAIAGAYWLVERLWA